MTTGSSYIIWWCQKFCISIKLAHFDVFDIHVQILSSQLSNYKIDVCMPCLLLPRENKKFWKFCFLFFYWIKLNYKRKKKIPKEERVWFYLCLKLKLLGQLNKIAHWAKWWAGYFPPRVPVHKRKKELCFVRDSNFYFQVMYRKMYNRLRAIVFM